jgi:hypothetical protein
VLDIDRTASIETLATRQRCLDLLADVEGYASWSDLITRSDVIDRAPGGRPTTVRMRATVLGLPVELRCAVELGGDQATLRRLPESADDPESYVATWAVRPGEGATSVELHVRAKLDAPGPASLLRGRVARLLVDRLVSDFAHAVG